MRPRTVKGLKGTLKSLSAGVCLHSQSSQPLEEQWGLAWEEWESKLEERAFLWLCVPLLSGASEAQIVHPLGGFFWSMCHREDRICRHFPRSTRYFDIFPRACQKNTHLLKRGEDWKLTHASLCDPYPCPPYHFRWLLVLLIYLTCNKVTFSCLLPHPVPLIMYNIIITK